MVRFDLEADPVDRGEPTVASVVVSDCGKRGAPALPENPIQAQRQLLHGLFCHHPSNSLQDRLRDGTFPTFTRLARLIWRTRNIGCSQVKLPASLIVDRASIAVWLRRGDDTAALHPRFTHGPQTYLPAALPFAFNVTSEAFRSAIRSTAGAGADFGVTVARV
jgi:hypothetical protein